MTSSLLSRAQAFVQVQVESAQSSSLGGVLVRRSLGSFALAVIGTALGLGVSVFLARLLGASGYGAYTYAKAVIGVLGIFAPLGFEILALRNLAAYEAKEQWGQMRGILRRSVQLSMLACVGLAAIGAAFALYAPIDEEMRLPLLVALFALPIGGMMRIFGGAIQGLQHVVLAQVPTSLLHPFLVIAFIAAGYWWLEGALTPASAIVLGLTASCITVLVLGRLLVEVVPDEAKRAAPVYETESWLRSALPLLFVNGVFMLMAATDTLMIGALKDASTVGNYAVAKRGAMLIMFVSGAVNTALSPTISNLYAQGERETLQGVITKSVRLAFVAAAPVALVLVLLGGWFLMIFGPEFAPARDSLSILSIGQVVAMGFGSVSLLLMMTGNERDAAIGAAFGALLNAGLNAALIPAWGMEGAAVATSTSMIVLSAVLVVRVRRRIGIRSTILGFV